MSIDSEPTVLPGMLLSDLSIVEHGTQKRSLIGCFDRLAFQQFPAKSPRFFVSVWVTNLEASVTSLELTIRIEIKGHVVFSTALTINFPAEQRFERSQVLALSAPVHGVSFPHEGVYSVCLLLEGEKVGERAFEVIQAPAAPATPH